MSAYEDPFLLGEITANENGTGRTRGIRSVTKLGLIYNDSAVIRSCYTNTFSFVYVFVFLPFTMRFAFLMNVSILLHTVKNITKPP